MGEYDVSRIFKRIEELLIASMIRNLSSHRVKNDNWDDWRALQLKELERYRKQNKDKFGGVFSRINKDVADLFARQYRKGAKDGVIVLNKDESEHEEQFFGINDRKVNALIEATTNDLERGEQATLRRANDAYRKIIFDAQMYASAGGTYEQAVDMATKDFLRAGIRSIEYSNGSLHSIREYASMAIRTGNKRAYLMGEGNSRKKYGVHTVRVNTRHDEPCPLCIKWIGKVLVDDVYSGGTKEEAKEKNLPLLSQAMALGFLHPNCKDMVSTYIEGASKPAKKWTKEELQEIADAYNAEQEQRQAENMVEKYDRLARYSLEPANKERYKARADEWKVKAGKTFDDIPAMLEQNGNGGMNVYTHEEIETMTQGAYNIVNRYLWNESKYSGVTNVNDDLEGPIAYKDWNCDITVLPLTSMHTLIHEHIHAHSISYFDKEYYIKYREQEEGAVELLAREISKKEGYSSRVSESYDSLVEALREKRMLCKQFDNDLDFALELIKVEPKDREKWIEFLISNPTASPMQKK